MSSLSHSVRVFCIRSRRAVASRSASIASRLKSGMISRLKRKATAWRSERCWSAAALIWKKAHVSAELVARLSAPAPR